MAIELQEVLSSGDVTEIKIGVDTVVVDATISNIDNTSDLDKPVSTATQVDFDAVDARILLTENDVDALEVATSNIDNTADLDKPVSTAIQTALDDKADAVDLVATDVRVTDLEDEGVLLDGRVVTLESEVDALELQASNMTAILEATRTALGFDREVISSMGIIQYCHDSSTNEVHQIDENGLYTLLTSQTFFADGITTIASRTLTMYHSTGESDFSYRYRGTLWINTLIKSITLPDTGGGYIYFNELGNLELDTGSHDSIVNHCIVTYLNWNTDTNEFIYYADERHGLIMDPITHKNIHNTRGFAWGKSSGSLCLKDILDDSGTHGGVEDGVCADEDIPSSFSSITTATHFYKSGASGQWVVGPTNNIIGMFNSSVLAWNDPDAGGTDIWGLTDVLSDTEYLAPVFWATNNKLYPIIVTTSQYSEDSRTTARVRAPGAVYLIEASGLPGAEMVPIGSMIIHGSATGIVEIGGDLEIWTCLKRGFPVSKF